MNTPMTELRLKRDIAVLEVQLAEQEYDFVKLILKARKLILSVPPFPDLDYQADRRLFLAASDKFVP